ncbi:MAG: hypothetical protein ACXVXW_00120 [Mycobacteriaceae bacterium]
MTQTAYREGNTHSVTGSQSWDDSGGYNHTKDGGDPADGPARSARGSWDGYFCLHTGMHEDVTSAIVGGRTITREKYDKLSERTRPLLARADRKRSLVRRLNAKQMLGELSHLMRHEREELADALDVDPADVEVELLSLDGGEHFVHTYRDGTDSHRCEKRVWSMEVAA